MRSVHREGTSLPRHEGTGRALPPFVPGESIMSHEESSEHINCAAAQEHMAACWMGEASAAEPRFNAHLASCAACREGMAQFSGLWESLGDLPAPEPSDAAAAKWMSVFETLVAAQKPARYSPRPRCFFP